jgi:L-2-hydroxycarboxylate dehydrogenase (NAD+)
MEYDDMLDRFKVPETDAVRVSEQALRATVAGIFERLGVPPEDAAEGANTLVMTDLRGVDTHGVSNMLRRYIDWYRTGRLNPAPTWTVLRETPAIASIDGDGGLGIMQGPRAMRLALEKARNVGVGIVSMRNSGHLGAAGHMAMIAAQEDMVGISMSAAGPRVLPTFGAEPRLGTNPIAYAAPTNSEPVLLFDVSTTVIAENKLGIARRVGALLEPNWIADLDGTPITEHVPVPESDQYHQLPLGGTREHGSHKGYGFGLLTEVMSTMLSGGIPSMLDRTQLFKHHFAAYDIQAFTDLDQFKVRMDAMLRTLRNTPPTPGHERVLYPGLLEHDEERQRRAFGIPLHPEVIEWFDQITEEMEIPRLETLPGEAIQPCEIPDED